jgi:hypothetical protein
MRAWTSERGLAFGCPDASHADFVKKQSSLTEVELVLHGQIFLFTAMLELVQATELDHGVNHPSLLLVASLFLIS